MGGELIGLVAVILFLGIPLGGLYTYYRVRKLRTEERLAALARGVEIPMEPEVNQAVRSRRNGILFVAAAIGYIAMFGVIARVAEEPDTWAAAAVGFIPLAIGIGYFIDSLLVRRDMRSAHHA
ncbi:MAG TPA: DUF6249 domain-containing protein [Candidatus Acidoferrales bacterium]|nr:DUF6249 domain-containing protein [Candidatus Acidoferrales bacterium]